MVSNRSRLVLAAAALSLPALALGGCGSSAKSSSPTTAPPSKASTPTTVATATPSTTPVVLPGTFPHTVADKHNVNLSSCVSASSGWKAGGTAHNPGKTAAKWEITVYFTDSHATTLAYSQTKVNVGAGRSAPWTVSAKFTPPSKVLCVVVGVGAA